MTRDVTRLQRQSWSPVTRTTLVTAGVVVAALWCMGLTDRVRAHEDEGKPQQAHATPSATMQTGMVTSVNSGQIRVNDTNYPLDTAVSVSDDEGHPRDLKAVVPETQILYHVHRGHVDHIVVVLPK